MILALVACLSLPGVFLQMVELDSCGWPTLVPKLTVPQRKKDPVSFWCLSINLMEDIDQCLRSYRDLLLNKGMGMGKLGAGPQQATSQASGSNRTM